MTEAWVYILQCSDGSYYTGWTTDVLKRYQNHCSGKGARYTRSHPPVAIVYRQQCSDRSEAMKREAAIKKLSRREKEKLICEYQKGIVL